MRLVPETTILCGYEVPKDVSSFLSLKFPLIVRQLSLHGSQKCNATQEYGPTLTPLSPRDGSVITKALQQIEKHSCLSRLVRGTVLDNSK